MKDRNKAEEIAAQRMQWIAPLLSEGLDAAQARALRARICEHHGISERTLRRYLANYRQQGFAGLKPEGKPSTRDGGIPTEVLEQAILLRREVPQRSVAQIIQILEWEGRAEAGQLKRSTLQDQLSARGYSSRHMRLYAETGTAARRFQRRHRNQLWHSDLKYGPYLPIGQGGHKKQVFLVTFLDDATRLVLHGEFYPSLDQTIVEDCFRQALGKYGVPEAVYFDNGKQYRNRRMQRICSELGIRLLFAKPYAPEATGKIERFNRVVDSFLQEARLEKPQTLEQLNRLWTAWLGPCYQSREHSALDGKSPETAFGRDPKELRLVDSRELGAAFLHREKRKVDKAGCISFLGRAYEVGLLFIGHTVEVIYDPADISELTIVYENHAPWTARPLIIGERSAPRPSLPEHLQPEPATSSRLLEGAKEQSRKRQERQVPAVSYRRVREDEPHV